MKTQKIKFKNLDKGYSILIGSNILSLLSSKIKSLCPQTKKIALIFDKGVPSKYKKKILKNLKKYEVHVYNFNASEKVKSIKSVTYFLDNLLLKNFNRSDLIIGIGGGSGTQNLNADELSSLNAGNKIVIGRDGVQTGDVDINAWDMTGKSYDVEIYGNDINMGGITMGEGSILVHAQDNGGDTGDLVIDGNIDRDETGTATLDIRADNYIGINTADIESSDGSINIILNADRDADEEGRISINTVNISTNGGYFIAGGGNGDVGGANGILGDDDGTALLDSNEAKPCGP